MDIASWFKRFITLPKGKNSLSDILGSSEAGLISGLAHNALLDAVTTALTSLASNVTNDLNHAADFITAHISAAAAGHVDSNLVSQINDTIVSTVKEADNIIISAVPVLSADIVAAVSKLVKLS